MNKSRFNVNGFDGVVLLKQYAAFADGNQYVAVAGKVSVQRDTDLIGFEVGGGVTANWALRVEGATESVTILGCQLKIVQQFDGGLPDNLDSDVYRVP